MKSSRKILAGIVLITVMLSMSAFVFAGDPNDVFSGTLYTSNPFYSAPNGYAVTTSIYDVDTIGAKVTVYNNGSYTDSKTTGTLTWSHDATTGTVYGSTYSSAGTTFKGSHWGSDFDSSPTTWSATSQYSY